MLKMKLGKTKKTITHAKPDKKANVGNYTVQVYPDGTTTVGIRTGKKPGPHYGGKGELR